LYGTTTVMAGSTTNLYSTVTGGTWTSGATSIATIGASSGVVNGIAAGTAPITYTVTGCSGAASAYTTVTVTPFDGISGHVVFGSGAYYGYVKVWLIRYDPATHSLSGYDSLMVSCSGTSVNYQFSGIPTDSFRVKAAIDSFVGTGYIPTYHNNYFYWHDANVIYHTYGTADVNKDINMAVGTSSGGTGFIAGDVYTGANKHTSGGIPAIGLHVCVVNSATGQLVQQTRTDATGHFTFSSLPVGVTYNVFPDSLNFLTSAYTGINLTTATPSMSVASFTMHTISKTITPHTQSVKPTQSVVSSVASFPNPANDKLYIQWVEKATEAATVVITDISGRELYNNKVDFSEGAGLFSIDLSSFANGFYIITVKTESLSYSNKLQVVH
jgi:Secretion system C-terminal sorting domain